MTISWEEAVARLIQQPDQRQLVTDCYFDLPLLGAAQRFAQSAEWQAVRLLIHRSPGSALDLGAGRGISSFALASDGWTVTALEPDPSALVGAGAILEITRLTGLPIQTIQEFGEELPLPDHSFDLVYGRQVLHHAKKLDLFCKEASRVLKPGGQFIATREHVISKKDDLPIFLSKHPLHKLYGGENAYLLSEYLRAISSSGLRMQKVIGPFDSAINYSPMGFIEWRAIISKPLEQLLGKALVHFLTDPATFHGKSMLHLLAHIRSHLASNPGRMFSFVAEKPDI